MGRGFGVGAYECCSSAARHAESGKRIVCWPRAATGCYGLDDLADCS
jgi:hypothetical protein